MFSIKEFNQLFKTEKPIMGMVHLAPLPGSPAYDGRIDHVLEKALQDAHVLYEEGVDALIVENFHDAPFFPETSEPETVACMTMIGHEVAQAVPLPVGINVLRNSWKADMAIANAIGGAFIRLNVLTDVMLTDQGLITGPAAQLARYRHTLGADEIKIFADLYCKHGSPLVRRPLAVVAKDMVHRGMADAIIVSGEETSDPPKPEDIQEIKRAVPSIPVLLGSGMTRKTVDLLNIADGTIFGYGSKRDGDMTNPVDPILVREFVQAARQVRGK